MYQRFSYTNQLTFFQKVRSIDYILLFAILLVGIVSGFSMYSIDGGSIEYYTQNHLLRFSVFFVLMLLILYNSIRPIILGVFLWSDCIWFSKMDQFTFY